MNKQSLNRLAPCMVAALVALSAHSACSQEVIHVESTPVDGSTFVGDMSCNSCGAMVENDEGLLQGKCPNCGGALGCADANGNGGANGTCNANGTCGANGKRGGLFGPGGLCSGQCGVVDGDMYPRTYGQPDLFYNYYTQGLANRANAQMYLCPHPIPPFVGHTFYTYQPFYPHHYMYPHIDKYHRYYDMGRGMNRTRATYWTSACSKATNFYWNYLRLPR